MDHEMKVSSSAVRRLRQRHGWSQEQLAAASCVSLRTIQRVEANGSSSVETALSLAATFNTHLIELQDAIDPPGASKPVVNLRELVVGVSVMSAAALIDAARLPNIGSSHTLAALEITLMIAGLFVAIPVFVSLLKLRRYASAILSVLGAPMTTLMVVGAVFAFIEGRVPTWQLAVFGISGAALMAMGHRALGSAANGMQSQQ